MVHLQPFLPWFPRSHVLVGDVTNQQGLTQMEPFKLHFSQKGFEGYIYINYMYTYYIYMYIIYITCLVEKKLTLEYYDFPIRKMVENEFSQMVEFLVFAHFVSS